MITFAHSFWSKPLLNDKFSDLRSALEINLVDYAVSVEYIHEHGHRIVLYTDEVGSDIFSVIPYDEIIISENIITNNYNFGASFKFIALEHMQLGEVLIDGDIFLYKPQVYNLIEQYSGDALVSVFEPRENITKDIRNMKALNMLKPFNFEHPYETPNWKYCDGWHNTSLMKFNNEELKKEYIRQYKYHANLVDDVDFKETWPDVIIEQRHLTQLCRESGYSVEALIHNFPSDESDIYANEIGFMHLWMTKRATLPRDIQTLQTLNQDLWGKLGSHISKMYKKYSK